MHVMAQVQLAQMARMHPYGSLLVRVVPRDGAPPQGKPEAPEGLGDKIPLG
jgi:hypothetical protein